MSESQIDRLQRKIDALAKRAAEERLRKGPTPEAFAKDDHLVNGTVRPKQPPGKKP